MGIMDNEGHDPMGLGNLLSRTDGNDLRRLEAENARLLAKLNRFADRSNWYFEGDHMCPEWAGKDLPWDFAAEASHDEQTSQPRGG